MTAFSDVPLSGARLADLVDRYGRDGRLDHTFSNGNRLICEGTVNAPAMRRTRVFFQGANNLIHLGRLTGISRLDIACVGSSEVRVGRTDNVRGATIMASHGATVTVGSGCMMSRDIIIYASGAHGLYSSVDGARRGSATIQMGDKVWLGQGARVLAPARIGDGSVIGSYSVLAGTIPNNCTAAGNPCRVLRTDVFWTSKAVEGNYFLHLEQAGKTKPAFVRMTEQI